MPIQLAMDESCDTCNCIMVTDMHNCICTGCGNCVQLPRNLTAKYRYKARIQAAKVRKIKLERKERRRQ